MAERFHVIDDSTPDRDLVHPEHGEPFGRGLEMPLVRDYGGLAEPFPTELIIPRSEWRARIEEREARGLTNREAIKAAGIRVKNQGQTNLCWANAPVWATEVTNVFQGQPHVELSPASVAGPINGYLNQGGWGKTALERIANVGAVPTAMWPDNAIDKRYNTLAAIQAAAAYRVVEWWVADPRDLDQLASALLRGFVAPVGFSWWGHEVTAVDLVWLDNDIALLFANNWGEAWQSNGYAVLQGSRMLPDDTVIPRSVIAR